ncbi:hypothetical protein GCM10011571_24900 [Marinithermofilum abyssi]|uniref:PpiC domain-containing protein n=1 Tax=Marinithermofilum abyssi TaxID=1571185 RepID=A0A8J2YAW6_9BACL|nr:peptidylprolyl isomerase [Marinithermofilum abyssi]GGE21795.1 hypothetical protein GCM10011571_24900 [Marinithermofilum abyssi]
MQQTKKRFIMVLSALLALSMIVTACGQKEDAKPASNNNPMGEMGKPLDTTSKKVIAEYNGGKVTEGELNLYLNIFRFLQPQIAMVINNPEAKKEIVKQFIAEKLIVQKVKDDKKYTKEADKALKEFENNLKQMPAQGKEKKKDMNAVLKENGITKGQLHHFLENNNKITDYFESKIKEEDLKKEYDKSDAFEKIKLNHILIATEPQGKKKRSDKEAKKLAEEVKAKLDKGEKFSELAEKYSDDPGSKAQGGEMEGNPKEWVPEFSKAAKTQPIDKIGEPVKSQFGYHIIQVKERGKEPFDKVKEQIKGQKIQGMYQDFIKKEVKVKKLNIPNDTKK